MCTCSIGLPPSLSGQTRLSFEVTKGQHTHLTATENDGNQEPTSQCDEKQKRRRGEKERERRVEKEVEKQDELNVSA